MTEESRLFDAIRDNDFELFKTLIKNGENIDQQTKPHKYTPLMAIILHSRDLKWIKFLHKMSANLNIINNMGNTALDHAIGMGDLEATIYLHENKGEYNRLCNIHRGWNLPENKDHALTLKYLKSL